MRRCWKDLNFQVSANGVHDLQGVWILVPIIVWTVQINLELLKRPHHKRVIVFMNVGGETRTSSHSATKHKRLFEVWFQKARAILSFRLSWDCPSDPSNTLAQFPVRGHIQQPGQIKSSGVVQDIGRIGWDYNHWTLSLGSDFHRSVKCFGLVHSGYLESSDASSAQNRALSHTYVRRLLSTTWNGIALSMITQWLR